MSRLVSIAETAKAIEDRKALLLDVRPPAAFNGWALRGEPRGGHVPGAVAATASWLEADDQDEVLWMLEDKGVVPERPVIVQGDGAEDAAAAADRLLALGFADVRIQDGGFGAWAEDASRPLAQLPRYRELVHPAWLRALLASGERPKIDGREIVFLHVTWKNREDYDRAHIAGAVHFDTMAIEEPEGWNRRSDEEVEAALLAHGIRFDTPVVLYGHTGRPSMTQPEPGREAGQIAAMRAAHLFRHAGVENLYVLDGGMGAWRSAGLPLTDRETPPRPVSSFGRPLPARPDLIVDIDEAKRMLDAPDAELVSVRSWAEFVGELSGYHYVSPKGRIPGAVFGNCGSDAYHIQNYRNPNETMRSYEEIARNWREVGVVEEKRIAFYCGTGWRASEAFQCATLMGWERIAVYDGGWYEWSVDAANPVETGLPQEVPRAFREHPAPR